MTGTCNPVPRVLRWLVARYPGLAERYLALDPRSLGLARLYLGGLLLWDLLRRVPGLATWYSDEGLLPRSQVFGDSWSPASVFIGASSTGGAASLFGLVGLAYLGFLIGWRTRVCHLLSLVGVVSLHSRVVFLENGGDAVLRIMTAWTLFLPMGARFSVDALRASLGARTEHAAAELADRSALRPETRPAVSLAVAALLLQIAAIYFFNAVHKTGATWRDGSAVHYVLHQDRIVTWLGWMLRPHLAPPVGAGLTYLTLAVEMAAPWLLLNPVGWRWTRRLAIALLGGLHLGIAALLNLGLFSFAMIGLLLPLIPAADWAWLARLGQPSERRRRIVYFDGACGICFQTARMLARWDTAGRLVFVSSQDETRLPADLDRALLERTMVVEDAVGGRRWTRSDGFAQVFLAVPWGWPLAAALRLPGLRILAGRGYDLVAHNRARLSAALGLAACGVPAGPAPAPRPAAGRPLRHRVADGVAPALREGAALILGLACVSQLLIQNPGVPRALRRAPPSVLGSVIEYPRLHQGWGMFAPEAPVRDHMLVVDAVTVDGRHVDPFNALASRTGPVPVDEIPERLGQDQFFCDYVARIANAPAYHGALRDWIERYPERTGQAADRLFSYEVYLVEDQSPPPGETVSRGGRRRWLFGRASS